MLVSKPALLQQFGHTVTLQHQIQYHHRPANSDQPMDFKQPSKLLVLLIPHKLRALLIQIAYIE
jgi:hypothetical protein